MSATEKPRTPAQTVEGFVRTYNEHAVFFKVRDGLITEYRVYEDASFITQLCVDAASIRLNT